MAMLFISFCLQLTPKAIFGIIGKGPATMESFAECSPILKAHMAQDIFIQALIIQTNARVLAIFLGEAFYQRPALLCDDARCYLRSTTSRQWPSEPYVRFSFRLEIIPPRRVTNRPATAGKGHHDVAVDLPCMPMFRHRAVSSRLSIKRFIYTLASGVISPRRNEPFRAYITTVTGPFLGTPQ
jgi:hypothetical protein